MFIKSLKVLSLLFIISILMSCDSVDSERITGSGDIVKIEYEFEDFNRVDIGYAFKSKISFGTEYKIVIKVDDNITEHLRVSESNGLLTIKLDSDNNYNDVNLEAEIVMPDLKYIQLSGASSGVVTGYEFAHGFDVNLSGASSLVATIICGNITLDLSGASNLVLNGIGKNLDLDVSGASNVEMRTFEVDNATVDLSGASKSTIFTNGILNASLSGASSLFYAGSPTMGNISTSGASTIQSL